ncbi:MAG: type II toxin-antitoxin system RatA family toxin, partial [Alphaproteobacteria bacterium]|nr:type II toxin-antitoxin system RatA family toxin [Alphaproteobacteria bacterium]
MQPYCFSKILPYPIQPLFDIVRDVDRYCEFLPGIESAQTYDHHESGFTGKLTIGYKMISQSYQSHVTYGMDNQTAFVHSNAIDGPFHHLISKWDLRSLSPNSTEITLTLDFKM